MRAANDRRFPCGSEEASRSDGRMEAPQMICFLTSRADEPETGILNPANGFAERLKACLPAPRKAVFVSSNPEGWERTDFYCAVTRAFLADAGLRFRSFVPLDRRNQNRAAKLIRGADLIVLAGGHVPTQNRFFREIGLKALLRGYEGVLIGISAGSMNAAETVYAQPEEEGEAIAPDYQRFLPGLGLTKRQILPHYQEVKDETVDGLRAIEDIAYPDSFGREFLIFPDGTYLWIRDGREAVCGEAYLLADGVMTQICGPEETVPLEAEGRPEPEDAEA